MLASSGKTSVGWSWRLEMLEGNWCWNPQGLLLAFSGNLSSRYYSCTILLKTSGWESADRLLFYSKRTFWYPFSLFSITYQKKPPQVNLAVEEAQGSCSSFQDQKIEMIPIVVMQEGWKTVGMKFGFRVQDMVDDPEEVSQPRWKAFFFSLRPSDRYVPAIKPGMYLLTLRFSNFSHNQFSYIPLIFTQKVKEPVFLCQFFHATSWFFEFF